jgi:acyl carrier protein
VDQKAAIHEFLRELLASKGDTEPLADDSSLIQSGRLQSADLVELVVFLEDRFGTDFPNIGFNEETFDNLGAIIGLIEGSVKRP